MKRNILMAFAMVTVMAAAGCHTTYVTVGDDRTSESVSASYKFGMLEAVLAKDIDSLTAATEKAMADLKMPIVNRTKDQLAGKIQAYTSDGKDVTIRMTTLSEGVTRLTIVVGSRWGLGDEPRSREIFQQILDDGGWRTVK
jgi:hypothetical protein